MDTSGSRRSVLRAAVLGGGASVALAATGLSGLAQAAGAATGGAATGDAAPGGAAAKLPPFRLFAQEDLNFETLFALGSAGSGTSEVGEIVTAVNKINAQGATYQAYYDTFLALANRLDALAGHERSAGHLVSARGIYLRAATYYDVCLFFVLGTPARAHEARVYADMQRCWDRATQLFDPAFERVRIPYGRTYLPGYLLRPPGRQIRRPTVILNNGSDGQNVDLYAFGGAAAIERGYNALIFEGPGQGSVLFEREIGFRPDWEHVVIPVVSYLRSRPDVDRSRIALTGWSMCGESVIRAAAFEHRLAAVVADPGVRDAWLAWPSVVRKLFTHGASRHEINHIWRSEVVPVLTARERYTFAKRSELFGRQYLRAARAGRVFEDLYTLGTTIMRLDCTQTAALVTAPTLITQYQGEMFYPGQGEQVYALLHTEPKRIHHFSTATGTEYHDAPMAPQTRNQVVFDWLDDSLR